jgi:hypothetical protein
MQRLSRTWYYLQLVQIRPKTFRLEMCRSDRRRPSRPRPRAGEELVAAVGEALDLARVDGGPANLHRPAVKWTSIWISRGIREERREAEETRGIEDRRRLGGDGGARRAAFLAGETGGPATGGGDGGAICGATRKNEQGRGERGEGVMGLAGVSVYPSQRDAPRFFRGGAVSLFGARSTELSCEARFGLRSSAGRWAVFGICSAVRCCENRSNKERMLSKSRLGGDFLRTPDLPNTP